MRPNGGILEEVLREMLGEPTTRVTDNGLERRWAETTYKRSVLYFGDVQARPSPPRPGLWGVYGDAVGGSLCGGSLRVALARPLPSVDLYSLDELRVQPEVERALAIRSDLVFFLDASNVWFYAEHGGHLFVFDSQTEELDDLGSTRAALAQLLSDWIIAKANLSTEDAS